MFSANVREKLQREFRILGLRGTESQKEIRKKYSELLRLHHPPSFSFTSSAIRRQEIIDAYHRISMFKNFNLSPLDANSDINVLSDIFNINLSACTLKDIHQAFESLKPNYEHPKLYKEFKELEKIYDKLCDEYMLQRKQELDSFELFWTDKKPNINAVANLFNVNLETCKLDDIKQAQERLLVKYNPDKFPPMEKLSEIPGILEVCKTRLIKQYFAVNPEKILESLGLKNVDEGASLTTIADLFEVKLETCTPELIKAGFNKLRLQYHPDKHIGVMQEQKDKLNETFALLTRLNDKLIKEYPAEQARLKEKALREAQLKRQREEEIKREEELKKIREDNLRKQKEWQQTPKNAYQSDSPRMFTSPADQINQRLEQEMKRMIAHNEVSKNPLIKLIMNKGTIEEIQNIFRITPEAIHSKDKFGNTLLHIACLAKREDILVMLCNKGVIDVHAKNNMGSSATLLAVYSGSNSCLDPLLMRGGWNEHFHVPMPTMRR